MRKTVKLTARRERALKRLETRLSGVRRATKEDFKSIGFMKESYVKEYIETHPYVFNQDRRYPIFYRKEDIERMEKEIDILKARI